MLQFNILAGKKISHRMISEAIQLDRMSYDDVYQLQVETCFDYYNRNSDIYIMAVDKGSGSVIGYINYSPIKKSVYKKMMSGDSIDTIISGKDVLPYKYGTLYYGYFSSIVVHPEFRQHGIATQMLLAWSDLMVRLAVEQKILFKEIVADAVSDIGAHLLSEIGFSFVKSSLHESKIMTLDLFSSNVKISRFNKKILAVYKELKKGGDQNGI